VEASIGADQPRALLPAAGTTRRARRLNAPIRYGPGERADLALGSSPISGDELPGVEAVVPGQLDRIDPELADLVVSLDVHLRWLVAVEAGEEQTVRGSLDPWHSGIAR
jgi:hypothetical protein